MVPPLSYAAPLYSILHTLYSQIIPHGLFELPHHLDEIPHDDLRGILLHLVRA